jgi:hypothetical protein
MLRKQGGFDDSDVVDFDALLMFHSVCAMEGESSTPPRSISKELKEKDTLVLYR